MTYGMGGANPPGGPPPGMSQPGYGAAAPGYGAPQGYEFDQTQNRLFESLAGLMKPLGILLIVFGVLALLGGMVNVARVGGAGAMTLLQGAVMLAIGFPLLTAATAMRRIVGTQGNDIGNLMQAMQALRRYFLIQVIAIGVAFLVGIVLGVVHASHLPH